MDSLSIQSLKVATRIGTHLWEQRITQPLLIDIDVFSDFSFCKDELEKTIDYSKLCHLVTEYVESNSFKLIETVAEKVAELIKKNFSVSSLTIRISKPYAIKNASNIRVSITR